jgi:cobaltochelatase CobT
MLQIPHLNFDVLTDSVWHCRGVADAIAMRLLQSNRSLHHKLLPKAPVAKLVFNILEQLRAESLAGQGMRGVTKNLNHAFDQWSMQCRGNGLLENELGLIVFAITQIVRSHLIDRRMDDEVNGIIESVRFQLAPIVGTDLVSLKKYRKDQKKYSRYALSIADAINEIAKSMGEEIMDQHLAALRSRNLLPAVVEQDDSDDELGESGDRSHGRDEPEGNDYQVYCRNYDKLVIGSNLYRREQRIELRTKLDKMIAAQAISVPGLAQRLKNLFAIEQRSGWHDGEEEGYIDGRRLGQIVSRPGYSRVFKQEKLAPYCDTVVSFLIDNSGSMKRQRFEAVAILVDVFCRALELAGVTTEILGFTTCGWTGGESIKTWRKNGSPENPGRLNDRMHIVYKDANTSWRRARYSISSLMNPVHFKEGLDGEALQWAYQRLGNRVESRKCLVMISDGAPMDSATSNYNDEYYLERHLKNVVLSIERGSTVELKSIGIGLDMEEFFSQAITLDLTGTLGNRAFSALELLFSRTGLPK